MVPVYLMVNSRAYIVFVFSFFLFSCGQTPKEKIESNRLHADSIKTARQNMLNAEEEASGRLDSIRKSNQ